MTDPTLFEREVEEDLRQDRIQHLWRTYGPATLAGVAIALALSAGYVFYDNHQQNRRAEASAAFLAAVDGLGGVVDPASIARFETLADAPGGYSALARLYEASLRAEDAEVDRAVALYENVASDGAVDRMLRDLAALKASYLQADREDPETFKARMQAQKRDDNVWLPLVKELSALAELRLGYRAGAQAAFEALSSDATAPEGLRRRASDLAAYLAPAIVEAPDGAGQDANADADGAGAGEDASGEADGQTPPAAVNGLEGDSPPQTPDGAGEAPGDDETSDQTDGSEPDTQGPSGAEGETP